MGKVKMVQKSSRMMGLFFQLKQDVVSVNIKGHKKKVCCLNYPGR